MGDEESVDGKVPWRNVVLWIVAAATGGLASWEYGQAEFVRNIREVQVTNSNLIQSHTEKLNDINRRIEVIESTKTDKRFRSDDWERERRILDAEFKGVWKAIDECKRGR